MMHRPFMLTAVVTGFAACGAPASKTADTPDLKAPVNAPAVIAVPLTVPKPNVPESSKPALIPADRMQRNVAVSQGYSLASATMVFQDGRMLSQLYHADAVLKTPENTIMGNGAIVAHLLTLARDKSLKGFDRTSQRIEVLDDSTLADSGSYVMVLKRSAADSVFERGRYATRWRARQDITKWVILEDQITPAGGRSKAGK